MQAEQNLDLLSRVTEKRKSEQQEMKRAESAITDTEVLKVSTTLLPYKGWGTRDGVCFLGNISLK